MCITGMRIAFVGGFALEPLGTIKVRTFPIAVELARLGHEVAIFLPPYDNRSYSGKQFESEGVKIINVKIPATRVGYPLVLGSLIRSVQRFRPSIVHVFKPKGFAGAAGSLLLKLGLPVVLDCDDWEGWGGYNDVASYPRFVKDFIDFQERWLMQKCLAVTVASRALEQRAKEVRGHSNVFLVPNCGVSAQQVPIQDKVAALDRSAERAAFGLPVDRRVIFYDGHFELGDDLNFLCSVCANVARRSGAILLFRGKGPELAWVQAFFAKQKIDVRYLPRVSYEQFLRAISVSDLTVFPYPDNPFHRSKCSTRIIDYMTMAKPVVTTAVGMNLEYIEDGESGILVPAGDSTRFEEEMERLVRDPERCIFLGKNAQRRVRERFSWNQGPLQTFLEIYRKILSPPPKKNLWVDSGSGRHRAVLEE